jgi:isoamylase
LQEKRETVLLMKSGQPYPLGATPTQTGVNFSIFSAHAKAMHLLLFDSETAPKASRVVSFAPETNRTGHYWHIHLPGILPGQVYAYRADGPFVPDYGYRFDPDKVLLDPYAKAICTRNYNRAAAIARGDNEASSFRNIVVDLADYDWEGDRLLCLPFRETVIYELHVGGFTRNPNSGISREKQGTYAGLIEKIPYLQELGITAVELLPVCQFDWQDAPPGLENYWGYSPVSFFAPHVAYSSRPSPLGCLDEFRDMIKALHRANIEVFLDVAYNHTSEGGEGGPTISLRGLDNSLYYALSPDRRKYVDFTGTGNTLNANQSIVRRLILDSLHYWVSEMHVDGFRFDLASVLTRTEHGIPVSNSPVFWDIDSDPVLAGTKLMAEAWDAAGLYQVGSFSKDRWTEWNGRFRDDVRSFLKSDRGKVFQIRQRLLGSPDLYASGSQPPESSVNFVTSHDGFTLNDLVSYNRKHNENNGEGNRDGSDYNLSWNCGFEGPTTDPEIEALRERQIRNAYTLTLLAVGIPLLCMADEVRRSQHGNNNAYALNNPVSWFDWDSCGKNAGLHRFVTLLIRLRRQFMANFRGKSVTMREFLAATHIDWHGVHLFSPDLSDESRTLAATAHFQNQPAFHLMLNAFWEPLKFAVPPMPNAGTGWTRLIDTSLPVPKDFLIAPTEPVLGEYLVQPRSTVLLINHPTQTSERFFTPDMPSASRE